MSKVKKSDMPDGRDNSKSKPSSETPPKTTKDTYSRNEAMQLYEKGLLSGKTLLGLLGFDASQEIERRKKDVCQFRGMGSDRSIDSDPEWIKLSKENMALGNRELESRAKLKELEILFSRIEHARRNVEALSRLFSTIAEPEAVNAIKKNIEIMCEVDKIK